MANVDPILAAGLAAMASDTCRLLDRPAVQAPDVRVSDDNEVMQILAMLDAA